MVSPCPFTAILSNDARWSSHQIVMMLCIYGPASHGNMSGRTKINSAILGRQVTDSDFGRHSQIKYQIKWGFGKPYTHNFMCPKLGAVHKKTCFVFLGGSSWRHSWNLKTTDSWTIVRSDIWSPKPHIDIYIQMDFTPVNKASTGLRTESSFEYK